MSVNSWKWKIRTLHWLLSISFDTLDLKSKSAEIRDSRVLLFDRRSSVNEKEVLLLLIFSTLSLSLSSLYLSSWSYTILKDILKPSLYHPHDERQCVRCVCGIMVCVMSLLGVWWWSFSISISFFSQLYHFQWHTHTFFLFPPFFEEQQCEGW